MKVESLVERVRQRYATARRYIDRGTVTAAIGADAMRIAFETSFERTTGRFSFSFTDRSKRAADTPDAITWAMEWDGAALRTVGVPANVRPVTLDLAIATFTGVSMGSAHTIPRLLMPEGVGGRELFACARVLGEPVMIDGATHLAIYVGERSERRVVYVNEATLAIRRIEGPEPLTLTSYDAVLAPAGRGEDGR